jgi:hypothetical protein
MKINTSKAQKIKKFYILQDFDIKKLLRNANQNLNMTKYNFKLNS